MAAGALPGRPQCRRVQRDARLRRFVWHATEQHVFDQGELLVEPVSSFLHSVRTFLNWEMVGITDGDDGDGEGGSGGADLVAQNVNQNAPDPPRHRHHLHPLSPISPILRTCGRDEATRAPQNGSAQINPSIIWVSYSRPCSSPLRYLSMGLKEPPVS